MATKKKMLQAAAGNAGGAGEVLNVEDVFSTYLYTGNGSTQTITNGIDLAGEGGLVWWKRRDAVSNHLLTDSDRGITKHLTSQTSDAELTNSTFYSSFNSDGFTLGSGLTSSGVSGATWTFRKAPKFFDVVTYTGDGVAGRTISHNLGCAPGCIIVKATSTTQGWPVYHRSLGGSNKFLVLNLTNSVLTSSNYFGDPTDTNFTVVSDNGTNGSGVEYVAYLFAHNDGDGEFGPDGDQDIIKCGSYTGNGSTDGPEIDLGWEPQWFLHKRTDASDGWPINDSLRGFALDSVKTLRSNTSSSEGNSGAVAHPTATGFKVTTADNEWNASGGNYIYIAIRRGTKVPESGTEVFEPVAVTTGSPTNVVTNFPVDLTIQTRRDGSLYRQVTDRLRGSSANYYNFLKTDAADAENNGNLANSGKSFDSNTGFDDYYWGANYPFIYWNFRRAPKFFDAVAFDFSGGDYPFVDHNLGVVPELIIMKSRNETGDWCVMPNVGSYNYLYRLFLNESDAIQGPSASYWANTAPTATQFRVDRSFAGGNSSLTSSATMIAYLFASLDGVSKVGSYTGNGTSQTIDCGFTSGARFVLIKISSGADPWYVFDTERGITVNATDGLLQLNNTSAEFAESAWFGVNAISPHSSGFIVESSLNLSGSDYIFYAIA